MGIKRIVDTAFWTDGKVDDFSPEDKYFMLYLLTNPFSTQLGIYEISIKQVAFQMGYSTDAVKVLIERFENKYGIILFSQHTNEIAIKNFLRHSIVKGGAPVRDCLIKEIKNVKNKALVANVFSHIKNSESLNETVKNIIADYEEQNGALSYSNEKQNDNENENENENDVSYHDTGDESSNESFKDCSVFLPLIDGTNYGVKEDDVQKWSVAYPAVDVMQELHKMIAWLDANPKNRKTAKGIKRFIIGWLGRTQDKAPKQKPGNVNAYNSTDQSDLDDLF